MLRFAALALPLTLAACGGSDGNTSISINDGNVAIATDAVDIGEANFNVSGVKLYPGSTIRGFDLDASDEATDKRKGRVGIAFEAPASLDKVQAWFRDNMAKRGFKVSAQGSGFAGTTDDGDPITLELSADGADKSKGKMTVGT